MKKRETRDCLAFLISQPLKKSQDEGFDGVGGGEQEEERLNLAAFEIPPKPKNNRKTENARSCFLISKPLKKHFQNIRNKHLPELTAIDFARLPNTLQQGIVPALTHKRKTYFWGESINTNEVAKKTFGYDDGTQLEQQAIDVLEAVEDPLDVGDVA